MNTKEIQSQCMSIHNTLAKLKQIRHYFFLTGLMLWIIFPLYGIILLLFYCQINISIQGASHKSILYKNLIPLIIFLFTITVFMSSFNSFSDTDIYIGVYQDAASNPSSLIDYMSDIWTKDKLEPLTFALPMYISQLSNGNASWFLLFQSLTMNTAFTVYSILFLPEVYPIVILINIFSRGYYYQLFLMRQSYSFIFMIPWFYLDFVYARWTLIFLASITHVTSLIYPSTLIFDAIYNQIKKYNIFKLKLFWIVSLLVLVFNLNYIFSFFIEIASNISTYSGIDKFDNVNVYSGIDESNFYVSILNQIYSFGIDAVVISIFIFNTDAKKIPSGLQNSFLTWRSTFYLIVFLYLISNFIGFISRIYYIFNCLPGFFYTIPFYSGKLAKRGNNVYANIIFCAMFVKVIVFITDFFRYEGVANYLYFWDGTSLNKTIIEYLYFLYSIIYS